MDEVLENQQIPSNNYSYTSIGTHPTTHQQQPYRAFHPFFTIAGWARRPILHIKIVNNQA